MIEIIDKSQCCGCNACVQCCPKESISMHEDEEGFLYPRISKDTCIGCGLCEKVCPVLNQKNPKPILKALAAISNDDEARKQSSSGGIFSALAEFIIKKDGVVFGAAYKNDGSVAHRCIDSIDEICLLRGSKYLQSTIGNVFIEAKSLLDKGRLVLFTGVPCQIAALRLFLKKEYTNLYAIDIICHGVPSPMVWHDYLQFISNEKHIDFKGKCIKPNFRDKAQGWRQYQINITLEKEDIKTIIHKELAKTNLYMKGFSNNLFIRPSCFKCPAKGGKSNSDITLGDFWGIEDFCPELDDNKGTSVVVVHNDKGLKILSELNIKSIEVDTSALFKKRNVCYYKSTTRHKKADFWQLYKKDGISAIPVVLKKLRPSLMSVCILRFKQIAHKMIK